MQFVPRAALFLTGVAAGAIALSRRETSAARSAANQDLCKALADMKTRLAASEAATALRLSKMERRLDDHAAKLAEVPTTAQLVTAMEQLLTKTMASLDERLSTQANSIEVLKATVSQTDSLLERVLESLDSLQTFTDPSDLGKDALLRRPA